MSQTKLRNSFKLIKEDVTDIYSKIDELSNMLNEIKVSQMTIVDKLVKKADKKAVKKAKVVKRKIRKIKKRK